MYPVLFQLGPIVVYTFGFALTIAALVSTFLIWRRGRKLAFNEESIIDMVLISLITALIFSRAAYVLTHWDDFKDSILKIVVVTYFPGFDGVFALIGGLLGSFLFAWVKKWNLLAFFDCIVIGVSLGISIIMLGSFFAGNFVGAPTTSSLGVIVPGYNELRHPVALYYSAFSFVLFMILILVDRKRRRDGLMSILFFTFFGLALILFEWYINTSIVISSVHINQLIGFVSILVSLWLFYYIYKDVLVKRSGV
jgi:phosphatidylglycerol---prolipoprotein diacylglyceryl transferase